MTQVDTDANVITSENAAATKKSLTSNSDAPKKWTGHLAANVGAAEDFVNSPPAQLAGEASFSQRDNGQVWCFIFSTVESRDPH
jgi:hypothetical protein